MPLACNLPPEFEYVGSAPRKLGLVLAFVVAGASGIAVFITDSGPDPDPMNAMALAPVEALSSAIPIGRDGPALLSSERATPVAATPDGPDGFAKQADAGPAMDAAPASAVVEPPTRAASVEKVRTRSSQVHRRDRNGYSSSPRYSSHSYYQSGYARVW